MTFAGEEFYKNFFCEFQVYVEKDKKKWNKASSDLAWTIYVKDEFLSELAKKLGFDETDKESIHGIDLTWERSSDSKFVAIEHENDVRTVWANEVPNLLKSGADLKILITYVDDGEFPGKEIATRLLNFLKGKNFSHEFLLILGTKTMHSPTDWIGYVFHRELEMHSLVFSTNSLRAWNSPGRKAWRTRKAKQKPIYS